MRYIACLLLTGLLFGQKIEIRTLSEQQIESRLRRVTEKNSERKQILVQLFQESRCPAEGLQEQPVKRSKLPNVICTIQGNVSESTIIVGAHFDHVSKGKGVVDNWSGASLLPSLLESISVSPLKHKFVFIGFSDEEKGLVGSYSFVSQLKKEDLPKIRAMVNLDSLGSSFTRVWVSTADKELLVLLDRAAGATKTKLAGVDVDEVGRSDSEAFRKKKIPTLDLHSLTSKTLPILHTTKDDFAAIQWNDYYESYRLIAAYLIFLDQKLD